MEETVFLFSSFLIEFVALIKEAETKQYSKGKVKE